MNRQEDKQEEYIQYLYSVIDILKQKLCDSESQCKEYSGKVRHSEKICDEKEKFILFQESQLSESEDAICKLKQRIAFLTNNKMSGEGSIPRSRSRSRSQTRAELISLETLSTALLLDEINTNAEELFQYTMGEKPLQNMRVADHLKNRIARASELVEERYDSLEEKATRKIEEYKAENFRLNQSLLGALAELEDTEELENILKQSQDNSNEAEDNLRNLLAEFEILEGNYNILINELQRNLDRARQEIAERDVLLNHANIQLENCRQERGHISALYGAEQILTRRLTRQRLLLKMTNRQLLIRLMNLPLIVQPQPIDQIWLLLH